MQLIQLGVVTRFQHTAIADHRWRVIDNRPGQQLGQFRVGADDARQLAQVRCFQIGHGHLQRGQRCEGVAQACQIARAGIAQADAGEDAFQVADFFELRLQGFEAVALEQASNRFLARFENAAVAQRAIQPAAEQAAAHGGLAAVDH